MNQEIPKLLRNALARQAVGDVHPSPDVLTSFMERTLAPMESEVVTHHLAQCAECREIVFLASERVTLMCSSPPGEMSRPPIAQRPAPNARWPKDANEFRPVSFCFVQFVPSVLR